MQLEPGEQLVDLQFAGLRLIQNEKVLKFGTDSVLLASFIRLNRREKLVDLGTGTGILPILLSGRVQAEMVGIELQPQAAELARRNVQLNGLERVRIVQGDLKEAAALAGRADVVCCNPPYDKPLAGEMKEQPELRIARYEIACTLEDIVKSAAELLSTGGRFYMVHRPFRLVEIFQTMTKYKLEPKRMKLVYPMADREPNMVLIEGIRGAKSMIKIEKPLIVYEKPGVYTSEIYDIYGY